MGLLLVGTNRIYPTNFGSDPRGRVCVGPKGDQGKKQLFGCPDSGPRGVLVAIGRQCGYKLLSRESNVSLSLHQMPRGDLDPVSRRCKMFATYDCCLLGLREKDRESDREGPRDGHCHGQEFTPASHS